MVKKPKQILSRLSGREEEILAERMMEQLAESVLGLSDEEVYAEAREVGSNPEEEALVTRSLLQKAAGKHNSAGENKLESAMAGADSHAAKEPESTIGPVKNQGIRVLPPGELELAKYLAEGLSNQAIGNRMGLSQHIVKNYVLRLFDRLGVSNRVELIARLGGRRGRVTETRGIETSSETKMLADEHKQRALRRKSFSQEEFHNAIMLERMSSERSRKPFLLLLMDGRTAPKKENNEELLLEALAALSGFIRETDAFGWYANGKVVGVMFTEVTLPDQGSIITTMMKRMTESLRMTLGPARFDQIRLSFHLFPDDWDHNEPGRPSNSALYPDLTDRQASKKKLNIVKRTMDITGSALAVIALAPVLVLIAVAIKLTSKGPVFFRQKRVGQYGECFTFLKFRSMYVNNDSSEHHEYVRQLIAGNTIQQVPQSGGPGAYKLTNDPRVTPIGRFLRRTSLDELPQFFNVFLGDMSLVGPRPPIPYEVEAYDIWHRRRVLEAKPGITGLWQVNGRSRVKFDDMVRLDLQYARNWTPWMDLWILLRTPAAVVLGEGAH